jgi:hypothetical protein
MARSVFDFRQLCLEPKLRGFCQRVHLLYLVETHDTSFPSADLLTEAPYPPVDTGQDASYLLDEGCFKVGLSGSNSAYRRSHLHFTGRYGDHLFLVSSCGLNTSRCHLLTHLKLPFGSYQLFHVRYG